MAEHDQDEVLQWLEEEDEQDANHVPAWPVLVVDDDDAVHAATRLALHGIHIQHRPLELTHASSASEAREILEARRDFAVILLDVVMESGQAGLELVGDIRNRYGMSECRIILRTGQPGYAPEISVFNEYDINDYRTKSELTRTRLITAITAALRSYDQIRTIAENRRGLELIVSAVADLMEKHALTQFAEGVLTQMTALLKLPLDGIVCAQRGSPLDSEDERLYIVGAAGRLAHLITAPVEELHEPEIETAIFRCINQQAHLFETESTTLYLKGGNQEAAVYLHTGSGLSDQDRQLVEVFAANISACFGNVKQVEMLNYVAYHDTLTRLANRSCFILWLDVASRQRNESDVVCLLDVDHFADVNDALGHDVGNALLVAVADRLEAHLGKSCKLARTGADIFGLLGPESELNPANLQRIFSQPFAAGEHHLPVSISCGYCRMLESGESGFTLLKRANIALNRAKKHYHESHEYFMADMEDNTRWRLEVIRHLRQDFQSNKLQVWYQPQIELNSNRVVGMEALVRWPGENGFVQPPSVFIPLAEYSGLIVEIGEWVLAEAADAWRSLQDLPNAPHRVAVNVSMPQFRNRMLIDRIAHILGSHRLPPTALELEITESIAMDEPKVVISALGALKELGIRISIDDFGTGFSSLGQLRALPINCLKIDQSFIREIANGRGGMYAETIVALASKLGLSTIAEGVETTEQAGFLRGLGCDEAQGYLYAKPMTLADLRQWLEQRIPAHRG
ncbi:putative bifunctional diguanylate cyclase/phosphodiesterase [Chitinilyticum piscinae]|uniref:EAL domain-containing protein n=1 Tax=Chitinilyticum piscinae TaxID=2866724 RepID=A0A8J7G0E1_9NEIS|nr:EAL domain-containing protein [Chitinilyticum piscinae]MBE9609665.1 EAL domain-containing protein [Chitinilyticum piscinae]